MANNPNDSSNKSIPNQSVGGIAAEHIPSDLVRFLNTQDYEFSSQKYKRDVNTITNTDDLANFVAKNPGSSATNSPHVRALLRSHARAVNDRDVYEDSRRNRMNSQYATSTAQTFAGVNGIVQQNLKTSAFQHAGLSASMNMSSMQVERGLAASAERMSGLQSQMNNIKIAGSWDTTDPDAVKEVNRLHGMVKQETNTRSTLEAAQSHYRSQGQDQRSIYASIASSIGKAGEAGGSAAGGPGKDLFKSFEKLDKIIDKTSDAFEIAQKETLGLAEKFAKTSSGGGSRFTSYLNAAAATGGAIGGAMMQIGVNQHLAMAGNAAGLANIENQKYQTYKAAAGGDIASLMMLSQFGGAENAGIDVGKNGRNAVLVNTGASGIDAIASGAEGYAIGGIGGAIGKAAGGVGNAVAGGYDFARDVTQNQSRVAMTNASLEARRQIQAVGAEQVQGFSDFTKGMGTAARGAGAAGEGLLNRTLGDSNLSRMAGARISPEQMAQMSQMGVANMGSMFNENQIFTARGNEQRGLGTMQENMQRMASLSAAGSNNPASSLGAITEAAVAKGLDSSKALNAVVDHTATMAASSSGRAMGLDTGAAQATLLMSGITKDTPNKEAAITRAASIQDAIKGIGTNTGVDYAGMVNTTRMAKVTGLDRVSAQILQGMDTGSIKALVGDPNAADKLLDKGIDVRGKKNLSGLLQSALGARQLTIEEGGGIGFGLPSANKISRQTIADKLNAGQPLSENERLYQGQVGSLSAIQGTGKEVNNAVGGVKAAVAAEEFGPKQGGAALAGVDKILTAGAAQLSEATIAAANALGGATTAVGKLTLAFEGLIGKMPGVENEATTAAGKSAGGGKGLDVSVDKASKLIDKLGTVLDNVINKQSLGTDNKQRTQINH
jgi:hypothetical protein